MIIRVKNFTARRLVEVFQVLCLRLMTLYVLAFLDCVKYFFQLVSRSPLKHVVGLYIDTSFVQTVSSIMFLQYPTPNCRSAKLENNNLLLPYFILPAFLAVVYATKSAPAMLFELFGSRLSTKLIVDPCASCSSQNIMWKNNNEQRHDLLQVYSNLN